MARNEALAVVDVGLTLRVSCGREFAGLLPAGRLLCCGPTLQSSHAELRRPLTVLELAPQNGAKLDAEPLQLHVCHCPELVDFSEPSDAMAQWTLDVLGLLGSADLPVPVLLSGSCTGVELGVILVAVLCCLEVPAASIALISAAMPIGGSDDEFWCLCRRLWTELSANELLRSVDSAAVRCRLLGACAATSTTAELRWVQEDIQSLCRIAAGKPALSDHWLREIVTLCSEFAHHYAPQDAAVVLYCKGWALGRLNDAERANEALNIATVLAGTTGKVAARIAKERNTLSERFLYLDEHLVLLAKDAIEATIDPAVTLSILNHEPTSCCWQCTRCPMAFSWLREGELAVSAVPSSEHSTALEALHIKCYLSATSQGSRMDLLADIAAKAAASIRAGNACLLHCEGGFGDACVAAACFLVSHGLTEEIRSIDGCKPRMSAPEAIEVLRSVRCGALPSHEEETIYEFDQAAWAKFISQGQNRLRPKTKVADSGRSATASSAKKAPSSARVVKQPGDGNCLFHSLAYGIGGTTASALRTEICAYMETNPSLSISDTPLSEWILMLDGRPVHQYAKDMAKGSQWGGAPEIAVFANMRKVNVHVYERRSDAFELTVEWDVQGSRTVSVLYVGGVHYDALVI